jgi:uncharacterized protein
MIGRNEQIALMTEALASQKSSFMAFTGRRRVGKTFLINHVFGENICLGITGIQGADIKTQIVNFAQKITEYSQQPILIAPKNWQEVFIILKDYLKTLPKDKKQVIFIDELPWMCTSKSGFLQLLAHLWNDYLSKESHFILAICGSATSWITKKIINDTGGLHNRITQSIHLKPFTLGECKAFFDSKNMLLTNNAIIEIYMAMGGIPFYLENIRRGESPSKAIQRMCFTDNGILKNEYQNLYKALFENSENHEALVEVLATSKGGISQEELLIKSRIQKGGPFNRTMNDLILSGFVVEEQPFGKAKRGSVYRLVDEFSVFHHRFIKPNRKATPDIWEGISVSQTYKIWQGFAFETICLKHIQEIKTALGIRSVYTKTSSFAFKGNETQEGFQIDLVIDRKDETINLCECKFYQAPFEIDKKYALTLKTRKVRFREATQTKKLIFNTIITNYEIIQNEHSLDSIDVQITVDDLMK